MNKKELAIIKQLDDGSLYAAPSLVEQASSFYDEEETRLLVSHDEHGNINGYIPVKCGYPDQDEEHRIYSYLLRCPPSISATYTPGAEHVLPKIVSDTKCYMDDDVIADFDYSNLSIGCHAPTASAYCLDLEKYLNLLSASRRKDFRRKLKVAEHYTIVEGSLDDVKTARPWIEQRRTLISECSESTMEHISNIIAWLTAINKLERATLKIDKYLFNGVMVGVNCCVVHTYNNQIHCDDYLTWHDPFLSPGLGIVSAIKNITNPDMQGVRYNMGTPTDFGGSIIPGFAYKWDLIPESIRLKQSIILHDADTTTMTIGLGGGCHWCTEAIYASLKGILSVEQGWISSYTPDNEFSEAVLVTLDKEQIDLIDIVEIHLYTHSSTSNHSLREKYRSAVYATNEEDQKQIRSLLMTLQKDFEKPLVTRALLLNTFKKSAPQYIDYFYKNPDKPFCQTYIQPKLKLLLQKYPDIVEEKLKEFD